MSGLQNSNKKAVSTHSRTEAAAATPATLANNQKVSTHSRTEAAALILGRAALGRCCFNTQPHGGGCSAPAQGCEVLGSCFNTQPHGGGCFHAGDFFRRAVMFQHTAARRRLHAVPLLWFHRARFQHTAARRRLLPT